MSYHLRLCKALSYCGAVSATKDNPDVFVDDKATADAAAATGYFKLINDTDKTEDGKEVNTGQGKTLDEMNISELETFAAFKDISLKGITKKADIIAKLKSELGAEETEGEIDYGSPTVTELQGR